jgi:hypothetical protein
VPEWAQISETLGYRRSKITRHSQRMNVQIPHEIKKVTGTVNNILPKASTVL